MGIQPDVLDEARVRAKINLVRAGRVVPVKGGQGKRAPLILCFDAEHWRLWQRHVSDWGISSSLLMCSLVHAYLLGSYEPEAVTAWWVWEGRRVPVVRDATTRVKTLVSHGAREALNMRARYRGCTVTALLRGLVLDNMAGRFGRRGLLKLIDTRSMPDDVTRYYLGVSR